jgi:hypothetical protein
MMGGADKIIARGQQLHDQGSYLLASEIVKRPSSDPRPICEQREHRPEGS